MQRSAEARKDAETGGAVTRRGAERRGEAQGGAEGRAARAASFVGQLAGWFLTSKMN